MIKEDKQYFSLVDPEDDILDSELIPLLWNELDKDIFNYITEEYINNVYSINEKGEVEQVSVIYVELSDPIMIEPDSKIFNIKNNNGYLIVNL